MRDSIHLLSSRRHSLLSFFCAVACSKSLFIRVGVFIYNKKYFLRVYLSRSKKKILIMQQVVSMLEIQLRIDKSFLIIIIVLSRTSIL